MDDKELGCMLRLEKVEENTFPEEKTKEPETQRPTEEKTTPEATEGTTQNSTKATIKKIQ